MTKSRLPAGQCGLFPISVTLRWVQWCGCYSKRGCQRTVMAEWLSGAMCLLFHERKPGMQNDPTNHETTVPVDLDEARRLAGIGRKAAAMLLRMANEIEQLRREKRVGAIFPQTFTGFQAKVCFINVGQMPAMKVEFDDE